jgi:putative ABC transport system substrate-binding protein
VTRHTIGLIVSLVVIILGVPLVGGAQAPVPRVGFLDSGESGVGTAFRHGLQALGYVEGQNIMLERRSWQGHSERAPELIAELVHLPVDVLVVQGSRLVRAAQQATATVPIIMVAGGDPVAQGFVSSLAQPGGNITGLAVQHPELHGKTLELLKDAIPTLSRVAMLREAGGPPATWQKQEAVARALGLQLHILEVRSPAELPGAFQAAREAGAEALHVSITAMLGAHLAQIVDLAIKSRLPAMAQSRAWDEAGLLMSYGPDVADLFWRAASYVDKILKGAKPGDLPVERPLKFELVINLKTAQALGLALPPTLLFQADKVIQ